jgi:AraC-like DNA-binding protein
MTEPREGDRILIAYSAHRTGTRQQIAGEVLSTDPIRIDARRGDEYEVRGRLLECADAAAVRGLVQNIVIEDAVMPERLPRHLISVLEEIREHPGWKREDYAYELNVCKKTVTRRLKAVAHLTRRQYRWERRGELARNVLSEDVDEKTDATQEVTADD